MAFRKNTSTFANNLKKTLKGAAVFLNQISKNEF
jgi:hypothetical protein